MYRKKEGERALTQPGPFPQHLPIGHLDQRDAMLPAQRHHELLVGFLLAPFVQHAHVGLSSIERFGGFAEPAGEAVVDEGELQDALEGFESGLASRAVSICEKGVCVCVCVCGDGRRKGEGRRKEGRVVVCQAGDIWGKRKD